MREQTRRDAERRHEQYVHAMEATEQTPLDFTYWLLTELEQAERVNERFREEIQSNTEAMRVATVEMARIKSRLAKVPALVEALRRVQQNAEAWHGPPQDRGQDRALGVIAEWCREALTVWEQE